MSEVEFKKFAVCDTCGVETLCREVGDDDQCGGCYWAPINEAKHQSELAALRKQIDCRAEKIDAQQVELDTLREELAQYRIVVAGSGGRIAGANEAKYEAEDALTLAQAELAALREEINQMGLAGRDLRISAADLQQRLTAAEQQNAELVELLQTINNKASKSHVSQSLWQLKTDMANISQITGAALKPTESGASE